MTTLHDPTPGPVVLTTPDSSVHGCIRLRIGPSDVAYAGGITSGAKVMELFGDLETEIALRTFGNEGLCVAYDQVEFLKPLHSGDFVEAVGVVVKKGQTSRTLSLILYCHMSVRDGGDAVIHESAIMVARAQATIVPMK